MYHTSAVYNTIYTINGNYTSRPIYESLNKAVIKWGAFKLGDFDQMAWIIMGGTSIRFVSFSVVNDPRLAKDWNYRNNEMQLIDAPYLYLA